MKFNILKAFNKILFHMKNSAKQDNFFMLCCGQSLTRIQIGLIASILMIISLVPAGILPSMAGTADAETKTIIILPFEVNSQKDISFISSGIMDMLNSRLSWKDHVSVIDGKDIAGKKYNSQFLLKNILNKGGDLKGLPIDNYDYVLTGSITEFAGAFSIDVKVFNVKNKTSRSFFNQASKMEKIIPGVDILAAQINKKIFNRTTEALKIMVNHDKYFESKREKLIRRNPEKLLEEQFGKEEHNDRPFWKFWKKNNDNDDNIDQNENPVKEDKPFWKIW